MNARISFDLINFSIKKRFLGISLPLMFDYFFIVKFILDAYAYSERYTDANSRKKKEKIQRGKQKEKKKKDDERITLKTSSFF